LRWRARASAAVQSVVGVTDCLIVTALDNFAYCLSPQSGRRIWKRQLSGRILSQPLATSDGVLFAPLAGDECVVLDLLEGKKINSVNVGDDNNTAASPVLAGATLLITTRVGLNAYANAQRP
jgi:outer membrane protein assembly factor BamB